MSDKDYWKKVYDQAEPTAAKYLHSNGVINENPSAGGGGVAVESLSVTENGTYTAPDGKAYSPVIVNVPSSGGGSNTLYAWQDNSNTVYTSTPTPTTSNKAVYSDNGLYAQDISEVGEDTITTNFGTLTRYPDGDIQL